MVQYKLLQEIPHSHETPAFPLYQPAAPGSDLLEDWLPGIASGLSELQWLVDGNQSGDGGSHYPDDGVAIAAINAAREGRETGRRAEEIQNSNPRSPFA